MNHKRMEGNVAFKSKDYKLALAWYEDSLKDVLELTKAVDWHANELEMMKVIAQSRTQCTSNRITDVKTNLIAKTAIPVGLRLKVCGTFSTFLKNEHFLVLLNISTVYYRQYDLQNAITYAQMAYKIREDDLSCSKMALYLLRNGDMSFQMYYDKINDKTPFVELRNAVDSMVDQSTVKYCKNVWGDDINRICYGSDTLQTYLENLMESDGGAQKPQNLDEHASNGNVAEEKEAHSTAVKGSEGFAEVSGVKDENDQEKGTSIEKENCGENTREDMPLKDVDTKNDNIRLGGLNGALLVEPFDLKILDIKFVLRVLLDGIKHYRNVFNVVKINVKEKYYVFGDTHGNLVSTYNEIRKITGNFSLSFRDHLIFNGDFVDRGKHGLELVIFFILLKLSYPKNVHMNRGNHEFAGTNRQFDLYDQIAKRYPFHGTFVYETINLFFQTLPLCTIVNDDVFVVHGGLPADRFTVQDVYKLNRFVSKIKNELLAGLMWSDPVEIAGHEPSRRGIGVHYGQDVTERFLSDNNLKLVVRSHEFFEECYRTNHNGKTVTVFSSVNYVNSANSAVYLVFDGDRYENYKVVRFC
ncbi:phosphoprotein phosphatase [Trachipleistophora hominis]|uniref:Serine/threonine-protein phosphatase n=1 Tax=Trachipleistophora hominis TaxID=72359 RepID=L7JW33_TRAHO|nr:phosphoprotein phosphatase [Trachipleistophora hominis]